MDSKIQSHLRYNRTRLQLALLILFSTYSALTPDFSSAYTEPRAQQILDSSANKQQSVQQQLGSIAGKVVDQSGATIEGVVVTLKRDGESSELETLTNGDGLFSFTSVEPGPFQLTITYPSLAALYFTGVLEPGQTLVTPLMMLKIATVTTEVHVELIPEELAAVQVKEQEKQRIFGIVPNFYATYDPSPVPLRAKHKFRLAWKSTTDPFTILAVGAVAGFAQAGDRWSGYGQGAAGYAKRFGAVYGDVATGTYLGGAVLPVLLKQDPRYFYKGTGSRRSRVLHALMSSVVTKGDNGHTQVNYSNILGNLGAGALANLYYPPEDRHGARTALTTGLFRLGQTAVAAIFQEFLIPKSRSRAQAAEEPQP